MSDFKPVNQTITPVSADPGEEFPFLHTITVVDRVVSVDKPELVQNNIKTETVTLNLDSEWDGLSCIINIGNGETPTSLIWSGQPVTIPAKLMTDIGTLNVSVVGYGDDGALRAVTKKADAMFTVVASGYVEGDEPVPDPTTILGQLVEAANNANTAADRFNQASEDIGDISDAVIEVKGYADDAKASETTAASSATTASRSETNAAFSASAAKVSETNAADSATAAREAVDGFGLEVGTTTTGDPGTDAAVAIQKNGTKYTANFTIPRGDVGPAGVNENVPLGSTSGVVAQALDAYPALPRRVQVHGRTIENLWPSINKSQNDWTCTTDETGLMHVATTTTTTTYAYFMGPIDLVPGKTYTGIVSNGSPKGVKIRVQGTAGGSLYVFGVFDADGVVFTVPEDATDIDYCVACEPTGSTSVDYKTRVMLVEGDTVPDVFVPSGVHTVEPERLIIAGKNLVPIGNISSSSSNGINWKANDDKTFTVSGTSTNAVDIPFIPGGSYWNLPMGDSDTPYETPNIKSLDFKQSISLADGDTLAIDRDGTTQILHAEGEPTVLENVTLPELPAPTFNVYTAGGYIQPTVDVDYERDVNLVLQALEAKIASLEVNQTISQGA